MKIFVAGSTGVVGRLLLPKLVQAGHEVFGMTRTEDKDRIQAMGARAVVTDVFDRKRTMSVLAEVRPEVVIHQLTALSQRDFAENSRIRVEGTRNLVDAALAVGVRRMVAQSISWAYEPGELPASEEVALDLHSPMPRKNLIDSVDVLERAVAEIPHHVILRYGIFYGQGTFYDHDGFTAEEIRSQQVTATNEVTSFLHVEDAAHAALLALDWPSGPVNIVDDAPARGIKWLPVYAHALGAPKPETDFQPGRTGWARGASNAKARKQYGWKPIYPTWRTGFSQSLTSPMQ